ncbi:MAG: ABC transporter, partial [Treponema sp.]|nr:ABC transporter [Treponema sp.]
GAEDLDEWALYRIDRYIRGGGRVLFALEGVFVDSGGSFQARLMPDRGLIAMVSFYGATVKQELTLDRAALTLEYQTQSPNGALQIRRLRYPHWIGALRENAGAHPLAARFGGLDLFWPGHIELNPPEGVEAEILLSTSAGGWVQEEEDFATNPESPALTESSGPGEKKILAAALTGIFPGWFQGIPKPRREGSAEELPDMPAEALPSRILVIADTDLATDLMWYTRSERNLDFILQALDWLGNDDDLLGIRSRSIRTGRLDRIADPVKRAGMMDLARFINILLVPLGIAAAGILVWWKRRAGGEGSHGL